MSVMKRKRTAVEKSTSQSNDKKISNKSIKSKKTKSTSLWMSSFSIGISFGLFAFVYFVLLKDNNLTLVSVHNSPYFGEQTIDDLKWGSFRSGHYFGLKTLASESLVFGLMYFENRIIENNVRIRHWCDQSDRLNKYGWLKHDFHSFGTQQILDNDLNISTSFIVDQSGGGWRTRIHVDFNDRIKNQIKAQERRVNSTKIKINKEVSLLPYFALQTLNDKDEQLLMTDSNPIRLNDELTVFEFEGKSKVFRNGFKSRVFVENKDLIYSSDLYGLIDPPLLHVKEEVLRNLYVTEYPGDETNRNRYLIAMKSKRPDRTITKNHNLAVKQIVIKVPAIIDMEFKNVGQDASIEDRVNDYTKQLEMKEKEFDSNFEEKFRLQKKGYSNELVRFAQSALSNMLGSVGSFAGFSQVSVTENQDRTIQNNEKIHKYGPLRLLTSVPSRSFFPRGFLWDEGFHQLLISKYDLNLSKIILSSWFDLMNRNGWIPREVILGVEAEERVPSEFVVQNIHVANPPTFFLLVESILQNSDSNDLATKQYFENLFNKLVIWYDWFNRTQIGHRPGSYRWRGRNAAIKTELNVKTLSSGLDDYPRASSPTDDELHLDLLSWMMYATRTMKNLSNYLNHLAYERFEAYDQWLTNEHLDNLHWSDEHQMYCDIGLHSRKVVLKQKLKQPKNELIQVRTELEPAHYGCVPEFGYVSLFPLILQLIEPTNPRLGVVLGKLRDPDLLWSDFGLRSLSKNSSYYNVRNTEHDPPYWRSAVWLNINYLALKSLNYYSNREGPYRTKAQSIYNELKSNLIRNVFDQYKNRNYLYENYDDQTGEGKGCYPFTGWTALIVLIMSDNYN